MTAKTVMTPEQAKRYRTARFSSVVLDLQAAAPRDKIYLRYMNFVWNKHKERREVVFMCYRTPEFSHETFIGCYYESAMFDFSE